MIHTLTTLSKPLTEAELFLNHPTLEIEIGVGKGKYLSSLASAFPERRLIGLEKSVKWLKMADQKMKALPNVMLIHGYLDTFLESYIPHESVQRYHILFSDPWPKQRHSHRRIFQKPLMQELWLSLKPNADIYLGTDHLEYFGAIQKLFNTQLLDYYEWTEVEPFPFLQTNFQAKYAKQGRELRFAMAKKKGSMATHPNLVHEISLREKRRLGPLQPKVTDTNLAAG